MMSPTNTKRLAKQQRTLVTPEGISVPIRLASRGSRLGALIIDYIILTAIPILLLLIMAFMVGGFAEELASIEDENTQGAFEFLVVVLILVYFFTRYGYFMVLELGPRGATWGKRMVGIRVAARAGGRLTPEAVIARNLIRDMELFLPLAFIQGASVGDSGNFGLAGLIWFAIFMLFPFLNKDKLRAGDVIAGTWVVEAPRTKLAETLSTSGAAATSGSSDVTGARYNFGETELSVYGEHELQVLERVLREDKDEALEPVHAAICRKIGWDPGAGDERAFLEAFYAQLRAKLEGDMRFGKRKADKHS
ncbi:RDD family protein [uncultured Erythrobacter sp.]|uniref:RDD family protein n=1 Tax=uncultured Erythrobacter sp. TaxID=263913 RepID=UPI0026041618|nr:RDD family protein [uncultured Erythrobacter sp.]